MDELMILLGYSGVEPVPFLLPENVVRRGNEICRDIKALDTQISQVTTDSIATSVGKIGLNASGATGLMLAQRFRLQRRLAVLTGIPLVINGAANWRVPGS